jgi:hypothetical protein
LALSLLFHLLQDRIEQKQERPTSAQAPYPLLLPADWFLLKASGNQEDAMNPWKVSAQFAAFIWYSNKMNATAAQAAQFAKENWIAFLPYAHEGYGRLLIKIAQPRAKRAKRTRLGHSAKLGKIIRCHPAVAR